MRYVVLKAKDGRWYWELRVPQGGIVAQSTGTFTDQSAAFRSIQAVRVGAARSLVYDALGNLHEGI